MNKIFFLMAAIILQFSTIQMYAQGNNCESAIVCVINGSPVAGVMVSPDSWWYTFTLNADYTNVEISTCNSSINMSDVYLYEDCLGTSVANGDWCNQAGGNYNEKIELANLTAGTYYVEVVGDFGYPSGAYTLNITGVTSAINNDIGITNISKPVKNFNNAMPVTVTIENFGISTQSNFPVSYTFMGNTVTETYTGTLMPGESAEYTFNQTIDMSIENTYSLTAQTELPTDQNSDNDQIAVDINTYINPNALFFIYDDYAALPDNSAFDFTDDFTIEAWFYPHSTKMVGKLVSKHGNDGTNRSGYSIEYDGSNIKAVIGIGPNWMVVSEAAPPDQWHHVAMVYSSGTLEMYLNGVIAQSSAYGTILSNDLDLYIGASQQYGDNWTGYIEELRIWNDARTEAEIMDNMNTEINPQSENLLAYYDFNRGIPEGDNTAIEYLPDMTNNNFHADMHNFALQAGLADGNFFEDCNLDLTAPVTDIAELDNIVAECELTSLTAPTATDNCSGNITGTHDASLPITTQGTTIVTWTYDDGNGNTSTQIQNVVIDDVTAPLPDVETLANVEVECEVSELTAPTATDNCSGIITGTHDASLPITTQGTTIVTWTYDDGNGNTSTQIQNVVIDDVTVPSIACIDNQEVDANETHTYTVQGLEFDPINYDDNCEVESIENDFSNTETLAGAELPEGTTTIVWTITDIAGNFEYCQFDVVVNEFVGVNDLSDVGISIFPNPTSGIVYISSSINQGDFKDIEITDISGKIIYQFTIQNNKAQIDLSDYVSGVYFIKILIDNKTLYSKIIKQ